MENQFEFCPDTLIGRRVFRRRRTNLPCVLEIDDRRLTGQLLDISEGGAKVAATSAQPSKAEGLLHLSDRAIPVRVVWKENGAVGVHFDDLPSEVVNQIARESGRG